MAIDVGLDIPGESASSAQGRAFLSCLRPGFALDPSVNEGESCA